MPHGGSAHRRPFRNRRLQLRTQQKHPVFGFRFNAGSSFYFFFRESKRGQKAISDSFLHVETLSQTNDSCISLNGAYDSQHTGLHHS